MRSRSPFFMLLLAGLFVVVPHLAHATTIPYWGPIVPSGAASCPAGWGSVIQLLNNVVSFAITLVMAFIAPLMFAYAGFLYLTSGSNPGKRTEANRIMLNLVVGIVLALAGYLIVDFVLTSLTTTGGVSAWTSQMFSSGGVTCIPVASGLNQSTGAVPGTSGVTTGATGSNCPGNLMCTSGTCQPNPQVVNGTGEAGQACNPTSSNCNTSEGLVCDNTDTCSTSATNATPVPSSCTTTAPLSSTGVGACNATTVQQGAASGGYTISNLEAAELSCIAQYESACGATNPPDNLNYNWGKGSSAAGAFQVLLGTNSSCYNNAPCEQAGGTPGVPLNCSTGFSGGNPIPGSPVVQKCENAAGNVSCSASAAACLLQQQSFLGAYGADAHASACVTQATQATQGSSS